jgi:serine/threonine-protein kinase
LALDLEPGPHTVVISDGRTTVSRTVTVAAGSSSTVMAALGAAGVAAGWLSIASPVELQILEGGTLIGTTSAARVMLPAGRHDLVLSSTALGFQTPLSTEVRAGRTSTATVTIPNGSLSLNALPWANVWVDGRAVGTTPVANLEVPLGTHDIIWRHPQLGERRQTTVVTAKTPVRLVMDLNK